MEKTGKILKENREKKGYTVNEVSIATKISSRIIIAIEESVDEDLPPRTFLRGMVQSYAKFLKIDANHVLKIFKEEYDNGGYEDSIPPETETSSDTEKYRKQSSENKHSESNFPGILGNRTLFHRALIVIGIIVLIFVIIGIKGVVDKYERERQVTETPDTLKSIEASLSEEDQPTLSDETLNDKPKNNYETSTNKFANEQNNEKKETEAVAIVAEEPDPPKIVENVAAVTTNPKPDSIEPNKKKQEEFKEEKVEVAKIPTSKKAIPQEVIIEALDAVKINFRIDSGELKSVELKPDQVHTIKANSKIAVDITDGGVVNIIHNGKDRGVPGDLGKPVKVRYP